MNTPEPPRNRYLCVGLIVFAALVAYHNSFDAPFVFDDLPAIVENLSIQSFRTALHPPTDKGTSAIGRPIYNLSLALNHSHGGLDVRGYHAANLLIHTLAGLTLFGLVRRILLRPGIAPRFRLSALPLAFTTALLWAVHPLLTESVTLTVQRTESLVGLFYLLALYAFIRGAECARPVGWFTLSVVVCLLGVGTKEVIVTAPVMILLCDRTFFAGSFREAWRQRRATHLALFATWLPLAWLMAGTGNRGGTVGLGLGMSSWTYLLTQCQAIGLYLKLSLWPHPLVMDYGSGSVRALADVFPQGVLIIALLLGTALALHRKPALGFLGAWFFVILAPSSSFVPLRTQTIAEHRMYLPLAAVIAGVVLGAHSLAGRRSLPVFFLAALALTAGTVRRNQDYRSALSIWSDTVEKWPTNARAHYSIGLALSAEGRVQDAIAHYETALVLEPDFKEHHKLALALALAQTGRLPEALAHFEETLRLKPDFAEALDNYGVALARAHRHAEARESYTKALVLEPANATTRYNLANTLVELERLPEAIAQYREALRLRADYAPAHRNLANALLITGQPVEAVVHYEASLRIDPSNANARDHLALAREAIRSVGK
ncbi:MAG: tetratricopeptide repeat protein [Undibacterium sp.]|nr:tetratricopeptide repeat protein [Opitutaceae bacterium]